MVLTLSLPRLFGFTPMTILRIYSNQNITHECVYRYRINTPFGILLKNKTLASTNNSHYRDSFSAYNRIRKIGTLCDLAHFFFRFSSFISCSFSFARSFFRFSLYFFVR